MLVSHGMKMPCNSIPYELKNYINGENNRLDWGINVQTKDILLFPDNFFDEFEELHGLKLFPLFG